MCVCEREREIECLIERRNTWECVCDRERNIKCAREGKTHESVTE